MRVVKAEIQRDPVKKTVVERVWIIERVLLLPSVVALSGGCAGLEKRQAVPIVVLNTVHEAQNRQHQHVRNGVHERNPWEEKDQCGKHTASNQNDRNIATALLPAFGNDKRGKRHDRVHDQLVSRDVESLEKPCRFENVGMLLKESLVIEPGDIGDIDMMTEVFVAYVLERSVGGTAQPSQKPPQRRIVAGVAENQVVRAFMNQVRRNRHRVRQQKRRNQVDSPGAVKQTRETCDIANHGIGESAAVVTKTFGF